MRFTRDEPTAKYPTLPAVGDKLPLLLGDLVYLVEVHGAELVGDVVRLDAELLGATLWSWGEPVPPGYGYTQDTTSGTPTMGVAAGARWRS